MAFEAGQIVTREGVVVVPNAHRALGFATRARGLLGRRRLKADEALWFDRCASVHCLGMHYAIDVVHLNYMGRVSRVHESVSPFGWSACVTGNAVIELATGNAARLGIETGMRLRFAIPDAAQLVATEQSKEWIR